MSVDLNEPRTLGRTNVLILLGVALVVIVALLGYRATLGEHEVYAAEPAREMLAGENWLLQPFAGAFRTKKPPGQSWLIAASMFVTRAQNEYTARLPSALAATGLALLLASIGARLAGRRVGLIAGLMTLTCYGVQIRARLAEADMALALCVALSHAGVLLPLLRGRGEGVADRTSVPLLAPIRLGGVPRLGVRFYDGLLFWLALAMAFLIKGPIAFGFVLLPVAGFLVVASLPGADERLRDARRVVSAVMLNPVGIALGVLLIVGWPIGALMTYPAALDQWKHELVDRTTGEIRDAAGQLRRDPILAYLGYLPLSALPWTPFALVALLADGAARWRDRLRRDPVALLLVLWTLLGALMLTAIAFKRLHYALPAVPPVLLASALGFDRALAWFAMRRPTLDPRRLAVATIAGWFGIVGGAWVANQLFVEPTKDPADAATRDFAAEVNRIAPAGETIWLVGVGEDRTVWYLRPPVMQSRHRDDEPLDAQLARLPAGAASLAMTRLPTVARLAERSTAIETLAASRSYREKRGDDERRALVRLTPAVPTTRPRATVDAAQP